MGKKKDHKKKNEATPSNVHPINSKVGKYQEALDSFRKYPSVPAYLFLLDQALENRVGFYSIESELIHLIEIDDDQYFGAHGSQYFRHHYEELGQITNFRQNEADTLSICASLWKFLEKISTEDVWSYKNFLVGVTDYTVLCDKKTKDVNNECDERPFNTIDSERENIFPAGFGRLLSDAVAAQEEFAKKLSELAIKRGSPFVPWAAWVSDYLHDRVSLTDGIQDLSEYLGSYYVSAVESESTKNELTNNRVRIDRENARSLGRISIFLIFSRLFKKIVYKESSFEIASFYRERIDHLSSRDAVGDHESQAEYIIAISNLLMINAKLNLNSVEDGMVSEQELAREFLFDVEAEYLDLSCILPLPGSGFDQILEAMNPYEGDRHEEYVIYKALRVASYGELAHWNLELFDEMFEDAFVGMDPYVKSSLHSRIKRAARGWIIPFHHTRNVQRIYDQFWSDQIIVRKISDALFELDRKELNKSKFITEELDEISMPQFYLDDSIHPVIFTRQFSNKANFVEFKDELWIDFCHSLVNAGQVRHACTVLALHITIVGVNRFFNTGFQKNINVPLMMRMLKEISDLNSFSMVRQALADFFEIFGEVPTIYKGSLKEYLPTTSGKVVSIKGTVQDHIEKYKKELLSAGLIVTRLSKEASDYLLKGYTLVRSKDLEAFNLSGDAVRNYVLAVEGELRSRVKVIDLLLAEELKYKNVEIDWHQRNDGKGRQGVFRGLTSICLVLEVFSDLSVSAQEKLAGFRAIAVHKEAGLFTVSLREFSRIRNTVQHANGSGSDAGSNLGRVEELMFGSGGLIRILCETR